MRKTSNFFINNYATKHFNMYLKCITNYLSKKNYNKKNYNKKKL